MNIGEWHPYGQVATCPYIRMAPVVSWTYYSWWKIFRNNFWLHN